jgi:hypothetical protein
MKSINRFLQAGLASADHLAVEVDFRISRRANPEGR